jgi:hypothetical protein
MERRNGKWKSEMYRKGEIKAEVCMGPKIGPTGGWGQNHADVTVDW